MCGIIGVSGTRSVATTIYDGLHLLQHRGQDAAGIVTLENQKIHHYRGLGLAHDVFTQKNLARLKGDFGIGHVRYGTAGGYSLAEAQPFVHRSHGLHFSLAHNGNLVNCNELRGLLSKQERSRIKTRSDSELLLHLITHFLPKGEVTHTALHSALKEVMSVVRGAYSVVLLVEKLGLIGFRDPHGIRPLVLGIRGRGAEREYMFASESAAFSVGGFALVRDILPGECVCITDEQKIHARHLVSTEKHTPCIFEFVYFARPDSLIDDISVHRTRMRLGQRLGAQILHSSYGKKIDCVVPVPESARTAAIEIAEVLKVPFREGFVKNRYIGRTFISPGQHSRVSKVRRKLATLPLELKGKQVLIVDDSIVRGTTIKEIVHMVRSAGAKKVFVASTAPAVLYENVYGIDIATTDELIAVAPDGSRKTDARIAKEIGADVLFYQYISDLYAAAHEGNPAITQFDGSCFDGVYVSGSVNKRAGKKRRAAVL